MNITDVPSPTADLPSLEAMVTRQTELMERYGDIERKQGYWVPAMRPVNIDAPRVQWFIKEQAWRITEELLEWRDASSGLHKDEELADAWHFALELLIWSETPMSTLTLQDLLEFPDPPPTLNPHEQFLLVLTSLGRAMQCLKNKPWKQTPTSTDIGMYQGALLDFLKKLGYFTASLGWAPSTLYDRYMRKAAVNTFRQESLY